MLSNSPRIYIANSETRQMKACPRITTLAVRSVLSPRIGLSLAFR